MNPPAPAKLTPLRRQYLQLKSRFPDSILMFRLGDFYETFDDDAILVAGELNIVLTGREAGKGRRIPMAGVPHHSLETHLAKLVRNGHKVAVCEQISEPSAGSGLVDRDVVRVVTPGTVVEPNLLDERANNYLASVLVQRNRVGFAYVDVSVGAFFATQFQTKRPLDRIREELERIGPAELLWPYDPRETPPTPPAELGFTGRFEPYDQRYFSLHNARSSLLDLYRVASLDGFGCAGLPMAVRAAGAIVRYLGDGQPGTRLQLNSLKTYSLGGFMVLDPSTRKNLELTRTVRGESSRGSLLWALDKTRTAPGARLLRRWLQEPLLELQPLKCRHDIVQVLFDDLDARRKIGEALSGMPDLERLTNRVVSRLATPRELVGLGKAIDRLSGLRAELDRLFHLPAIEAAALRPLAEQLPDLSPVSALIRNAVVDEPPNSLADGGVIATGFSAQLDELKQSTAGARQWIASLEITERERTGIKGLKVGYNRVFGYFIEVSRANAERTPSDYVRKQTLVNAERYITPELKEQEAVVLGAQEKISELEALLFRELCGEIADSRERLLQAAEVVAQSDVLRSMAEVAVERGYVRPDLDESSEIQVSNGRHPVVEVSRGDMPFVPNDVRISCDDDQIIILTGPNMAGKSTYLRQTALIVLMSQIGSFVPASHAKIGLVDRIFTRIGAQDDLGAGQSTFLVEMLETANLLTQCTRRSLLILDEVGRGTSTYDGLAIAQAVVEYIHNHPKLGSRTLFATHYRELTALEGRLPRVRNYQTEVVEQDGEVVFLHQVTPGAADRSYGVHVAQLAGVPRAVVRRAEEILHSLEQGDSVGPPANRSGDGAGTEPELQLSMFGEADPIIEALKNLDVMSITPIEALGKLYELQCRLRGASQDEG